MIPKRLTGVATLGVTALLLFGCQAQPMDMDQPMKAPPRPAELERLSAFIGEWEGDATVKMAGVEKTMTSKGHETTSWGADGWLIVSRFEYSMGDEGTATDTSFWTWDSKAKVYRTWHFDSWGGSGAGTMKYDAEADTWYFQGKERNPYMGKSSSGKGWTRFTDANTQEWSWTEFDSWGLKKTMEIEGVSRRK